jgi:hypothetical protein
LKEKKWRNGTRQLRCGNGAETQSKLGSLRESGKAGKVQEWIGRAEKAAGE